MSAANETGGFRGARLREAMRGRAGAVLRRLRRADWREWLRDQCDAEARARSGFLSWPIAMMLGILAVYGFGWRPPAWPCLAAAALLCWPALRRASKPCFLAAALLFGMGCAVAELGRNDTVVISGETTTRLSGRVLWRDRDERGRFRYLVAVEGTDRPTLSRPPSRVELLVAVRHEPIAIGGTYAGLVRLRPPSGPALPGGYDFAFGAFNRKLGGYGFALGAPTPAAAGAASTFAEKLVVLRMAISDRIRDVVGGAEGAVASAIITGERAGIPADVDEWLRVTGLSHVLSISGLHMALVAGFAMAAVRVLLAMLPGVAVRMPTRKLAAAAALGVSAFYLALSGGDVAAVRSFVMIAVMLTAVLFDRSALTLRNVAIAAIVVLCATPHAVLGASFQMSFAATIALVSAYGLVAARGSAGGDRQRSALVWVGRFFLGIAISSMIAGLATAPFAAYHFQRMAPFGLVANMVALPLFSVWIMPLALIAMLAMPLGADAPFLWLLGKGLTAVFAIARWLAERFPDAPTGLLTQGGLILLTIALLCACLFASRLRFVAVPFAILGIFLAPNRTEPPDAVLFEDGRELALISAAGELTPLKERPNAFVFGQWRRAFPFSAQDDAGRPQGFECETATEPSAAVIAGRDGDKRKPRERRYCRATTRSGVRLVWTDDYRQLDRACREGDLAIVARAIRDEACSTPTPTPLVTLRTLRRTGSIAIRSPEAGRPVVVHALSTDGSAGEWNHHRTAPWPERWRASSAPASGTGPPGSAMPRGPQ